MISEKEIWQTVMTLRGMTLYTYTELEPNHILQIENTGNKNDRIIIKDRETKPTGEDIVAAFKLLYSLGENLRDKETLHGLHNQVKKHLPLFFELLAK